MIKRTTVVYTATYGYVFRDKHFNYFVDLYKGIRPFKVESLGYGIRFLNMIPDLFETVMKGGKA